MTPYAVPQNLVEARTRRTKIGSDVEALQREMSLLKSNNRGGSQAAPIAAKLAEMQEQRMRLVGEMAYLKQWALESPGDKQKPSEIHSLKVPPADSAPVTAPPPRRSEDIRLMKSVLWRAYAVLEELYENGVDIDDEAQILMLAIKSLLENR